MAGLKHTYFVIYSKGHQAYFAKTGYVQAKNDPRVLRFPAAEHAESWLKHWDEYRLQNYRIEETE